MSLMLISMTSQHFPKLDQVLTTTQNNYFIELTSIQYLGKLQTNRLTNASKILIFIHQLMQNIIILSSSFLVRLHLVRIIILFNQKWGKKPYHTLILIILINLFCMKTDSKWNLENIQSSNSIQTVKNTRTKKRSIDVFSFSDEKQVLSSRDFDDDEIFASEAQIQHPQMNQTKRLAKMKYVILLQTLFVCLTDQLRKTKQTAFKRINSYEQQYIRMCRLSMNSIAQEIIIPYISQEVLKKSYIVHDSKWKQSPSKSASKRKIKVQSLQRTFFRFRLKIQKIQKMFQDLTIRQSFDSIKNYNKRRINTLKQIKKVQSQGQFNIFGFQKRRIPSLQVKIIAKYMKKVLIFDCFNRIKLQRKMVNIQRATMILQNYKQKIMSGLFLIIKNEEVVKINLDKLFKSLNLHIIRLQYKLIIQAFYKLKNFPAKQTSVLKAFQKIQRVFNKKQIKHTFSAFLSLRDVLKESRIMKSSYLNGLLTNFSDILSTKVKSPIEGQNSFRQQDSLHMKSYHFLRDVPHELCSFIQTSYSLPSKGFSKHQRPIPPSIFSYKFQSKIPKPVKRDNIIQCQPDVETL